MSAAAPATRDDLMARLSDLGVDTATVEHPAVYTVEESKAHRGELPGGHSKNLFLKDKKGVLWLVVCREDLAVDMKELRRTIGAANLSFGKPDLLMEVLGIEPGSVTPFSLINDRETRVRVILDAALLAEDPLNFHPLVNTATTQISPDGLLAFIRSCGHEPEVMALQT